MSRTVGLIATFTALALLGSQTPSSAQVLGEPNPVGRSLTVRQFGIPRDAKYIFCDGSDCPERTTKTLASPRPAGAQKPVAIDVPSPAKLEPPVTVVKESPQHKKVMEKKPPRKTRPRKPDCKTAHEK